METIIGKWQLISIQVYHPTEGWEHFIDTPGVEWHFHPDGTLSKSLLGEAYPPKWSYHFDPVTRLLTIRKHTFRFDVDGGEYILHDHELMIRLRRVISSRRERSQRLGSAMCGTV